jgi:hypothetical protein
MDAARQTERADEHNTLLYEGDLSPTEIKNFVLLPSLTAFARQECYSNVG